MDSSEYSTGIVLGKIPENTLNVLGRRFVQDQCDMAKLACLSDHLIDEELHNRNKFQKSTARTPSYPTSFSSNLQVQSPLWDSNNEYMTMGFLDSISEHQRQAPLFNRENHIINSGSVGTSGTAGTGIANDYYGSNGNLAGKTGRRFEFPVKTCHYFNKGFCKHGTSCRYYHGQSVPDGFSHTYGNENVNDDQIISPGSLAQLESEIVELLKLKKGGSISIASLPMAYHDKYKKVLQADGYLTESQRHGKSGYSLTKLLARLKNSIRLIDRPHGQHSVVLVEDAPKYNGKVDYGKYISASRQIYLTFPADSTFSEADVSNYFSTFGKVEDVRIPSQERRMFGFVTFDDPETVKVILDKGNPHYVCESRVLVKPYKEKPKLMLRKHSHRVDHPQPQPQPHPQPHPAYHSPHYLDFETEPTSIPRGCRNSRFLRRLLFEQQEEALEFQRRRFAELQLAQNSFSTSPHLGFNMDGSTVLDDRFNVQPVESCNHVLNDKARYMDNNYTDEDSDEGLNLPDSQFSFLVDSELSAVL